MLRLMIGNKAYSSWSLRGWLALRHAGVAFEEIVVPLRQPDSKERILAFSPSGQVPCLHDGAVAIWDSLALVEWAAEQAPAGRLWPTDPTARAVARSVSAEMHAGFMPLRRHMGMNVRKQLFGKGWPADATERAEVEANISRIQDIWTLCRTDYGAGGPFLFGAFSGADCMYAPVVTRFWTYGVKLNPAAAAYAEAVMEHPLMREWIDAAHQEEWVVAAFEA